MENMNTDLAKFDLVVGVLTRNCEDTITDVIKTVDAGLSRFFPQEKSIIVVSDLSEDDTRMVARNTKTINQLLVTKQEGCPGKGMGVKTVFKISQNVNSSVVALVDGDLTSIEPWWVNSLIEPVLSGYDLAVPLYERHKFDSVITNHVYYPLVSSLYGTRIRQPIGGEFGLSSRLVERLLKHPGFPANFGIDIFITTAALASGMEVAETSLGVKSHTSTEQYNDMDSLLIPMFNQSVSTFLELLWYDRDFIKDVEGVRNVPRFGENGNVLPKPVLVEANPLFRRFRKNVEVLKCSSAPEAVKRLHSCSRSERLSLEDWMNFLYKLIPLHKKDKSVLDVLRAAWIGRFATFVKEAMEMTEQETESYIQSQTELFANNKNMLLERI